MTQLFSSMYSGRIKHTRLRPFHHDFEYRVFFALIDLDELDELNQRLKVFSVGRFNLFSFDPTDHGPLDGSPLRPWAETLLAEAGVSLDGGQITLLAFPRVLGYAFNPISEWYCYGPDGDLRAVIHEVRNTFGDRHSYVVPIAGEDMRHSFPKKLHVSPFNDMEQSYRFTVNEPSERLLLAIEQVDEDGTMFRAGMSLTRMKLNDRNLTKLFVSHPLLTLKVIGGIHWQALRLWIKGARYHKRPEPGTARYTIVENVPLAS